MVYDSADEPIASAETNQAGQYTVLGLSSGSYQVQFTDDSGTGYLAQYYKGQASAASATSVSVTPGESTTGIDAALQLGGQVSGTVTAATSDVPLPDIQVWVFDANGNTVGQSITDAHGHYAVNGLATGSYRVQFVAYDGTYADQYYDGQSTIDSATPVSVVAGQTTSGIGAALVAPGQITGVVTDRGPEGHRRRVGHRL